MTFKFKRISKSIWITGTHSCVAFLKEDDWDDYSFRTLYFLTVFDEQCNRHEIGSVKIGCFGQEPVGRENLPTSFSELSEEYFSLGQDPEYYQNIERLSDGIKSSLLIGLKDIAFNQELLSRALQEDVTKTSLLRFVSTTTIHGQFRRLLGGGDLLTEYKFQFDMPQERKTAGLNLKFSVNPESNPPTNIHVLIGRNGVGKTHLLNKMVNALVVNESTGEVRSTSKFSTVSPLENEKDEKELFAGVVSVAFSAFDPFDPYPEQKDKTKGIRYSYVGLNRTTNLGGKRGTPMSHEMLTNEFVKSLNACITLGKAERWKAAIQNLESDPYFNKITVSEMVLSTKKQDMEKQAVSLYKTLSSGHRIVLLTLTKLVEKVEEKTLVLIDEPEAHLHPPLLSAFTRSLSDLLSYRNGVAIIATHSPVIVQEVPNNCVWKLRRIGLTANAERPQVETFGENVGILTREIFGLEVTESGYHQLLKEALENPDIANEYHNIMSSFGNKLGTEARGILRGLLAAQEQEQQT